MRVLIFHGYLLGGTGSNVYTTSVARALAAMGHEVHLLCQDHDAGALGWIDAVGRWGGGELAVEGAEAAPGTITAYLPPIGEVLPVYVEDPYEHFTARAFGKLTDAEIEAYIAANVAAVREVAERAGGVDAALANHLVMGPVICARAGLRYAVKIHGSALSYVVAPEPERFGGWAREGLEPAAAVLVGSAHSAEQLWETMDDPELPAKTRLGPPGVDTDLFAPLDGEEARADALRALAASVGASPERGWGRDPALAVSALTRFAEPGGARVVFVGKLIVSKGIDLLLAAWPLVHRRDPDARLLLVGFGEYREASERMIAALGAGDLDELRAIAAAGRALEGGEEGELRLLAAFLARQGAEYVAAARAAADRIELTGRLSHEEVGRLVPACDALVFPSTFPESFGMVAAEAAAAGVLPVCADHSGISSVAAALAAALSPPVAELVRFDVEADPVPAIAERIVRWLGLARGERDRERAALREVALRQWGWEGVARGVLSASAGRLADLPPVPSPHRRPADQ